MGAARRRNPQHFHRIRTGSVPLRTSHPHLCAQPAGKQFSCHAGRPPVSAVLAGHGQQAGHEAPGLVRMRSCRNPGHGCSLPPWAWATGIAVTLVIAAGIPVLPARRSWKKAFLPGRIVPAGQNQTRPPMYEMGGLARPRHTRPGQLPGLLAPRAARRCQAPVQGTGLPAPPTLPGRPGWCPFPTVKAFLLPPRTRRKSLK